MVLCILTSLTSCGTLKNGHGWGQDATFTPGWNRIGDAAFNAATLPETWIPLAGALIFRVDSLDKRLSNYASSHTPVFGSQKAADNAGYLFRDATRGSYVATLLVTPSGNTIEDWVPAKVKGLAVGLAAVESTDLTTGLLKDASNRRRPSGSNNNSFPSSLASSTSVYASLASRNLESLPLDENSRIGMRLGMMSLSFATAWARLEANAHYPSDALSGIALGYFTGVFFNDAFLGLTGHNDVSISLEPTYNGTMIRLIWSF